MSSPATPDTDNGYTANRMNDDPASDGQFAFDEQLPVLDEKTLEHAALAIGITVIAIVVGVDHFVRWWRNHSEQ